MIHFFKRKPFLQDLIPNDYIDIHSHLLPGIDDGAKDFENTSTLIYKLEEVGFKKLITTPHIMSEVWPNTKTTIEAKFNETLLKLSNQKIETRFKVAAEYMIDGEFKELLEKESLLTLKENYVLVEMSYLNPPLKLHETLYDLQNLGYQPVLAHPERYNFYHNSYNNYKKLKDIGCLFQLNLLSTVGYYGQRITKISDSLLKDGLIDFVGSDVHHMKHVECFKNRIAVKNTEALTSAINNNSFFNF